MWKSVQTLRWIAVLSAPPLSAGEQKLTTLCKLHTTAKSERIPSLPEWWGWPVLQKIGKNCKLAGQVGLAGHLTIGDNVQIGAQSGVTKSIKDNQIVLSSPAVNYKEAIKTYTIIRNLPKLGMK